MSVRSRVPAPLRALSHDATSTLTAVLLLGLALGTAAAAFSILHATVLAPFPFADQDQLALIWRTDPKGGQPVVEMAYRDALDISARSRTFTQVAALGSVNWDTNLYESGPPTPLHLAGVSGAFFPILQAPPLLGRTLRPSDDAAEATFAVVISHALWTQHFGSDPTIIGRTIRVNGQESGTQPAIVVGVMPHGFDFPRGADLWAPLVPLLGARSDGIQNRGLLAYFWLGRLRPHVTPRDAERELTLLIPQVSPDRTGDRRPVVTPIVTYLLGPSRAAVWAIFGLALLVWLLACANVSGLLLVQWSRRRHDIAIQRALGADTGQVVLHWLLQAAALIVGSGIIAIAIAEGARRVTIDLGGSTVPRLQDATIGTPVLVFGLTISAIAVLLAAAPPAWHAARVTPMDVLKRRLGRTRSPTQTWVVAIELIVAVVALAMAGRLVRAVLDLERLDFGFQPQGVLTMELRPSSGDWNRFYEQLLLPRARALPGVVAAGGAALRPLRYEAIGWDGRIILEGQSLTDRDTLNRNPLVNFQAVTAGYFEAAGIGALQGRPFDATDRAESPSVIVVGDRTARTLWPGRNPVGQRLLMNEDAKPDANGYVRWRTVIGVVKDVRYRGVTDVRLDLYEPASQSWAGMRHLMVRTNGDPLALVEPLRRLAQEIDSAAQIKDVATMPQIVYNATRVWWLTQTVAIAFGVLAIVIAGIGLYALLAHTVVARRYELAVRATLGARPLQLSRLVLRDTVVLAVLGSAVGLIVSVPVTNRLTALDVSHSGTDVPTLALVVVLLVTTTIAASLLPAVRAARSAPSAVLRQE